MTKAQATEKLDADKKGAHLTGEEYAAAIEATLPSHARRKWRLAFLACRDEGSGMRASSDRALQRCQRESADVYRVGNAQGWRA